MRLPWRKSKKEPVRSAHIEEANYLFRRSRTLTGSLSDSVKTVGEPRAALKSERVKQHTLRSYRRRIGARLLICLVIAAGLYGLLSQFIGSVTIASKNMIPEASKQRYTETIEAYLSASPTQRFSFSLASEKLLATVQQKHPEVEKLSLSRFGVTAPTIASLSLRTPVIVWDVQGVTYYIDSQGVAFQSYTGSQPTLRVEDNTGIALEATSSPASEKMLRYIGRLVALVSEAGYSVERLELPAGTSRQINLYLQGRGYPIFVSSDRDPAGQVADVKNVLAYFDMNRIVPAYVDARVSSKAYYQ